MAVPDENSRVNRHRWPPKFRGKAVQESPTSRVAAAFMEKGEQRLSEAAGHTDEPAVLAVARYSHRVAIARAQPMSAKNAFVIEKARSCNIHQSRRIDRGRWLVGERVCWLSRLQPCVRLVLRCHLQINKNRSEKSIRTLRRH